MGTKLLNSPPEEYINHPYLLALFAKDMFEPYLKGVNAYVARRFLGEIFETNMPNFVDDFSIIDGFELEDLLKGEGSLDYWQNIAGNLHDALMTGMKRPSNIKMHSVIGPVALAEGRYIEAIKSAFILHYLCMGGGVEAMANKEAKFNEEEKLIFGEVTLILRKYLNEALDNPQAVFEERVKLSGKGPENG